MKSLIILRTKILRHNLCLRNVMPSIGSCLLNKSLSLAAPLRVSKFLTNYAANLVTLSKSDLDVQQTGLCSLAIFYNIFRGSTK